MPGVLSDEALESLQAWLGPEDCRTWTERVNEVLDQFDVKATAQRVVEAAGADGEQYNVALQFPDRSIRFAPFVSEALRIFTEQICAEQGKDTNVLYFALGDTSYGECCVDEVAAQHLNAHLVVHYGPTCFSPTRTLPVSYIFPNESHIDAELAISNLRKAIVECSSSLDILRIVLLYDLELHSVFGREKLVIGGDAIEYSSLSETVTVEGASLRVERPHEIIRPGDARWSCEESQIAVGALAFERGATELSQTAFIWFTKNQQLSSCGPAMRNAALQLTTGAQVMCAGFYNASLTIDSSESSSLVNSYSILKKRFAAINKVKDAERIGIVPGTLGISGNVEVIERCKRIIKSSKKRSYTILVGKPNPSKLANFPEIELFVLVACRHNALLEGRDYLQPIVTPLELESALVTDRDLFSIPYSTDFRDLLKQELPDDEENLHDIEGEKAVSVRGDWSVSVRASGGAAEFLQGRSWQGLKYDQGSADNETVVTELPTDIRRGQTGIASKYDKEGT